MAILCFVGCFLLTQERVEDVKPRSNVREDSRAMLANKRWWMTSIFLTGTMVAGCVMFIAMCFYDLKKAGRTRLRLEQNLENDEITFSFCNSR